LRQASETEKNQLILFGFAMACFWPLLNFLNINYTQISSGAYGSLAALYIVALASIVFGLLASLLLHRVTAVPVARYLAVCSVAIVLFFLTGGVRSLLSDHLRSAGVNRGGTLLTLALFCAAVGVAWMLASRQAVRHIIAVLAIAGAAIPAAGLGLKAIGGAGPHVQPSDSDSAESGRALHFSGENVYYIIVDAYAGRYGLDDLGYDNTAFLQRMRDFGFAVNERARSNYVATFLTLQAILDARFPVTDASPRFADRADFFPARINSGHEPAALLRFRQAGYKRIRISNPWGGCADRVFDTCFGTSSGGNAYLISQYFAATIFSPRLPADEPDNAIEFIPHIKAFRDSRQPFFLFVHHYGPHPPYDRHEDCSRRRSNNDDAWQQDLKSAYVGALKCVNRRLVEVVGDIVADDPNAIIVIQSDHGAGFHVDWTSSIEDWTEAAIRERTSILNLVRLPARCVSWNQDDLGQINTMRLVLGCLANETPDLLPEASYISTMEIGSDFGLVRKVFE